MIVRFYEQPRVFKQRTAIIPLMLLLHTSVAENLDTNEINVFGDSIILSSHCNNQDGRNRRQVSCSSRGMVESERVESQCLLHLPVPLKQRGCAARKA
jgi:hypothetical protein